MATKTAMQELKDKLMESGCLADWMDDAFDEAIEKEKQQIIDACKEFGNLNGVDETDFETYYNQTYTP